MTVTKKTPAKPKAAKSSSTTSRSYYENIIPVLRRNASEGRPSIMGPRQGPIHKKYLKNIKLSSKRAARVDVNVPTAFEDVSERTGAHDVRSGVAFGSTATASAAVNAPSGSNLHAGKLSDADVGGKIEILGDRDERCFSPQFLAGLLRDRGVSADANAHTYLASMFDYIAGEVLEMAGYTANNDNRSIKPSDLIIAFQNPNVLEGMAEVLSRESDDSTDDIFGEMLSTYDSERKAKSQGERQCS